MNKTEKIDYEILKYVNNNRGVTDDDIVNKVYKKFAISNWFRINKIHMVDVYNRLLELKENGCISGGN